VKYANYKGQARLRASSYAVSLSKSLPDEQEPRERG